MTLEQRHARGLTDDELARRLTALANTIRAFDAPLRDALLREAASRLTSPVSHGDSHRHDINTDKDQ